MSNVEKDNLFEEMVNEHPVADVTEADQNTNEDVTTETSVVSKRCRSTEGDEPVKYDFWEETRKQTQREYIKTRVKGFFRALVEVGGYAALGGVMLAAMLNGIVAAYVAVPVFTVSWIWSAIRMDRFFRR